MTKTDAILIGSKKKLSTPAESDNFSLDNIPVKKVSTVLWNTQGFIVLHSNGQNSSSC